jgi:hypothetical protein
MSRTAQIHTLIADHKRHLQLMREKQARMGDHTPNYVLLDIEEREQAIKDLEAELEALKAHPERDRAFSEKPPGLSETIPWYRVKLRCQEASDYHLDNLRHKYNAALFVDRKDVRNHIQQFLDSADYLYLVLNGQSGMGKSGILINLEEEFRDRDDIACLIYNAGNITESEQGESSVISLIENLAQGLLPNPDEVTLTTLLDSIEYADGFDNQKLLVIIDAINESKYMGPIIEMLARLQHEKVRPWIKVIVSCRPNAWSTVSKTMTLPAAAGGYGISVKRIYRPANVDQSFVEVPDFTLTEAGQAYSKYQRQYKFQPERFEELSPRLQRRLKEPLLLWLVSEICAYGQITDDAAGTDIKVIPNYTEHLLKQEAVDDSLVEHIQLLEKTIPEAMVAMEGDEGKCQNTVARVKIPNDRDTAACLNRFIDVGILEETMHGKPKVPYIRFRYERFYDYYFSHLLRELAGKEVILDCQSTTDWVK